MEQVYSNTRTCLIIRFTLVALLLINPVRLHAQSEVETARNYVAATIEQQKLTPADVNGLLLSSAYRSPTTGWFHVYFNQSYQSVEVYNRLMNVVLVDKQVVSLNHNFISSIDLIPRVGAFKGKITPLEALQKAVANVGIGLSSANLLETKALTTASLTDGTITQSTYLLPALSDEKIDVKLYWLPVETDQKGQKILDKLSLTWNVRFLTKDAKNGWNIHVDALSGRYSGK
ncbi:hypothetical protein [Spirosoma telluris]|uniref:hypothetical protein n=1 Tax=Spirosoma telluris TaxID=2183553 RepID=UPI002FC341C8